MDQLFICAPFGTETQKSVALLPSPAPPVPERFFSPQLRPILPWKEIFNRANRHTQGVKSLGIMRHCLPIGHKKGGPPFRSSHILDPIPEGPNSVRVTFSRRSPPMEALDIRKQVQSPAKRAWNSSPSVTCTELKILSKTLNLGVEISNDYKLL